MPQLSSIQKSKKEFEREIYYTVLRTKDDVYKDSGDKFQNIFGIKVSKHFKFCNFYITVYYFNNIKYRD